MLKRVLLILGLAGSLAACGPVPQREVRVHFGGDSGRALATPFAGLIEGVLGGARADCAVQDMVLDVWADPNNGGQVVPTRHRLNATISTSANFSVVIATVTSQGWAENAVNGLQASTLGLVVPDVTVGIPPGTNIYFQLVGTVRPSCGTVAEGYPVYSFAAFEGVKPPSSVTMIPWVLEHPVGIKQHGSPQAFGVTQGPFMEIDADTSGTPNLSTHIVTPSPCSDIHTADIVDVSLPQDPIRIGGNTAGGSDLRYGVSVGVYPGSTVIMHPYGLVPERSYDIALTAAGCASTATLHMRTRHFAAGGSINSDGGGSALGTCPIVSVASGHAEIQCGDVHQ
ncbi:MAG TPA: hypothetical protein VL588_07215 [Bdellovibrionota bacterium]|jgi:hypothetical protein|nr:hypothetical protein [Bdellovibrionota bacterium]